MENVASYWMNLELHKMFKWLGLYGCDLVVFGGGGGIGDGDNIVLCCKGK